MSDPEPWGEMECHGHSGWHHHDGFTHSSGRQHPPADHTHGPSLREFDLWLRSRRTRTTLADIAAYLDERLGSR